MVSRFYWFLGAFWLPQVRLQLTSSTHLRAGCLPVAVAFQYLTLLFVVASSMQDMFPTARECLCVATAV